jgi:hypothetical protein
MAPTASLWNDIDAYLNTTMTTDLGASSVLYSTLKIAQVVFLADDGSKFDEQHATMPCALVLNNTQNLAFDEQGNVLGMQYPYTLVLVTNKDRGTDGTAYLSLMSDVKELARRLVVFVKSHPLFGSLKSTSGEGVWNIDTSEVTIGVWDPGDGNLYGACEMKVDIFSELP